MKEIKEYEKDLASIRLMMERSVKFISLSGLAGVLAGVYALIGAASAYFIAHYPVALFDYRTDSLGDSEVMIKLVIIALLVLIISVATGIYLSNRKAKKHGVHLWNTATKQVLFNLAIPLFSGGVFILIMLWTGHFGLAAPACLIFYGLALIQGSNNMFEEIRYLGYCEILLGLISAALPGYGLVFWAIGFGILHIVYGLIMYNKYDR